MAPGAPLSLPLPFDPGSTFVTNSSTNTDTTSDTNGDWLDQTPAQIPQAPIPAYAGINFYFSDAALPDPVFAIADAVALDNPPQEVASAEPSSLLMTLTGIATLGFFAHWRINRTTTRHRRRRIAFKDRMMAI